MSFSIPPRTSLMGVIAAAMGWPKDSYYEDLASENIRIGVRVLTPLKKSFHRLNLLSIKSTGDIAKKWSSDFRGEGGRIQTPFEVVSPLDVSKGELAYQVFLSSMESGTEIFRSIKDHFLHKNPVFNTTLGTANFIASIDAIELVNPENISENSSHDFILMHSAIPTKLIDNLRVDKTQSGNYSFIEEDMMPGDFMANGNREVRKMNRILFSTTLNPLEAKLNSTYYQVVLKKEAINIQFVDS